MRASGATGVGGAERLVQGEKKLSMRGRWMPPSWMGVHVVALNGDVGPQPCMKRLVQHKQGTTDKVAHGGEGRVKSLYNGA
jgi:hypothetical protein